MELLISWDNNIIHVLNENSGIDNPIVIDVINDNWPKLHLSTFIELWNPQSLLIGDIKPWLIPIEEPSCLQILNYFIHHLILAVLIVIIHLVNTLPHFILIKAVNRQLFMVILPSFEKLLVHCLKLTHWVVNLAHIKLEGLQL